MKIFEKGMIYMKILKKKGGGSREKGGGGNEIHAPVVSTITAIISISTWIHGRIDCDMY